MSAGSRRAAKKRLVAAEGLETAPDGALMGRDPRRLSADELRALGHRGKPLLQAIRRRCVDCCGGKKDEVRRCTATACPLWPYRMATDPWHPPTAAGGLAGGERPGPAAIGEPAEPASPVLAPAAAAIAVPVPAASPEPAAAPPRRPGRRRETVAATTPLLPFLDDAPA